MPTMVRVRKCRSCGANKVTKPTTSYVYCDFCAELFDFDWRSIVSLEDYDPATDPPGSSPQEQYFAELVSDYAQSIYEFTVSGDKGSLFKVWKYLFEDYTENWPQMFSPRIREPEYRSVIVNRFFAPATVAYAFDPACAAAQINLEQVAGRCCQHDGQTWPFSLVGPYHAAHKQVWEAEAAVLNGTGIINDHPDGLTAELHVMQKASAFVQDWLPRLANRERILLLNDSGVHGDYVEIEDVAFTSNQCGCCGGKLQIADGAKSVLCEFCGTILNASKPSVPCPGCKAPLMMPAKPGNFSCPYCKTLVENIAG